MIHDELSFRIRQALGLEPTMEQEQAIGLFAQFMTDRDEQVVMILRGSAGTGKTTLAAAIVKALVSLKQKLILLAPTGRAAKVFSLYAGHPAYTIHRRIYRQKSAGDLSAFNLNDNLNRDTLFIIDEASMISNQGYGESAFGSGYLLDDLMQFVYNGQNCRMLLIGDKAQLPPVGEDESPALMADMLRGYGMKVYECDLNQVLRQSEDSGILWNATRIRGYFSRKEEGGMRNENSAVAESVPDSNLLPPSSFLLPRIRTNGFSDIAIVPGDELIESLASSYSRVGMDETMVITRSNKRANIYNQGIRNMVLDREDELCRGDQLMIVKNNYFWVKDDFISRSVECGVRSENTPATESPSEHISLHTPHSSLHQKPKVVLTWAPHCRALPQAVPNSFAQWMNAADVDLVITHPEGYELDPKFIGNARVEYDQKKAFEGADFIYAKNWSNPGVTNPADYGKITSKDMSWTVDTEHMSWTNNGKFMHCLPVRRNLIVTDDVIESPNSLVIPEAANREISCSVVIKRMLEAL